MALQMFFVKRRTEKRYRDPTIENDKLRIQKELIFTKEQVVAIKYAPKMMLGQEVVSYQMILDFKCLGNLDYTIKREYNLTSPDYFNVTLVNEEDIDELNDEIDVAKIDDTEIQQNSIQMKIGQFFKK